MPRLACLRTIGLASALVTTTTACTEPNIPRCQLGEPRAIGFDEAAPDGTTARAFSERLPGSHSGSLKWFRSSIVDVEVTVPAPLATTTVNLEVSAPATSARYRPATPAKLGGTVCPGAIELDVALRVVTADGGLDEHWTATAQQAPDGGVSFTVDLTQQPVTGTLRVALMDPTAWDRTAFGFETSLDATGAGSGSVYASASRETNGLYEGFAASAALLTFTASPAPTATVFSRRP